MRRILDALAIRAIRVLCVAGALACVAIGAYLAFQSPFDGLDDYCGNFITNPGGEGYCGDILRRRVAEVIVLVFVAVVLVVLALRLHPREEPHEGASLP
jgi:hypothetical protein